MHSYFRYISRVGPNVIIYDDVAVKVFSTVYFDSFEVLALYLVGTFP